MKKFLLEDDKAHFTLRHRAVCDNGDFRGQWRDRENDAEDDAEAHSEKPGKGDHIVRIITEQTLTKLFEKRD